MSDPLLTKYDINQTPLPNPDNESTANNLLQNTQFNDTRLYDLLALLIDDVYKAANAINPRPSKVFGRTGALGTTDSVTGLRATLFGNNLRLNWDILPGAVSYEIRYKVGSNGSSVWDSSISIVTTATLQADINPITIPLIYGNHTFLVKAVSATGISSLTAAVIVISIPTITEPIVSATVIDNFVLLKWSTPAITWDIVYYNVYKDGTPIGTINGTFDAIFETTAGTYTYSVEAVDIVGNVGTRANLVVTVKQPPDYSIQDFITSNFSGTKVNAQVISDVLLAPVDLTTNWSTHFSSNAWTNIQDQINAGYPIYIQPVPLTASYEEVIDFGAPFNNTIITLTWVQNLLAGSVTVVSKVATSVDNITYTGFTTGTSVFAATMRYVKFRLELTASDEHGLVQINNLQVRLDVKREVDSGTITAVSTDVGGTHVNFNKTFQSIDSITLTVNSIEPITAIYDSVTTTGFDVYALDSRGNRITYPVSWKSRGIV